MVLTFSQFSWCYAQNSSDNAQSLRIIASIKKYIKTVQLVEDKQFVEIRKYVQPFITDWKYATDRNFTRQILYTQPDGYLRLPAAQALQKVQAELAEKRLSLKFYDAYRPYSVTVKMWKVVPDERYAANPATGSGHNRGTAVDVSLVDLKTGNELQMPTKFDDFTEKASHTYKGLSDQVIANRQMLKSVMEKHGFIALETEWWHYSLPNAAARFEVLDLSFKQMKKVIGKNPL